MASTAAALLALCFAQPWDADIAKQCASLEQCRGRDSRKKKEPDKVESQTERMRHRYRNTVESETHGKRSEREREWKRKRKQSKVIMTAVIIG